MADNNPIHQPPDSDLVGGEMTVDYSALPIAVWLNYATRPWFTLMQMRTMLLDQQVWFGLQLRNAPLMQAKVEVKGPSPTVNAYVQEQWDKFWQRFAPKVVTAKYYGYAGFEVIYQYKDNVLQIENLKDFWPGDVRALRHGSKGRYLGRVAGVGVHGHRQSLTGEGPETPTRLFGMKGLWLNYHAHYGSAFGEAATYKAYGPWWDKAMPGGAYDMRRLRAVKDAWIGDVIKFPSNWTMAIPDGTKISGRDLARHIGEARASGGVVWIPSDTTTDGKPLFEYQPPAAVADSGIIKQWIDDSDWDIFDGLLVPKEVVEASSSGSGFSGRSIPFTMFLTMGDQEFLQYVEQWKQQIGEPMAIRSLHSPKAADFEMVPVPLLDTISEKLGGQEMGGPVGGSSGQLGFHQGSPDGRPQLRIAGPREPQSMQFSSDDEAQQFATVDEPSAKRRAIRGVERTGGLVMRRLESLLKKN